MTVSGYHFKHEKNMKAKYILSTLGAGLFATATQTIRSSASILAGAAMFAGTVSAAEVLTNGSFQTASPAGWPGGFSTYNHSTQVYYTGAAVNANDDPAAGANYSWNNLRTQVVGDIASASGLSTTVIDSASARFAVGAWLSSYSNTEFPGIELKFFDTLTSGGSQLGGTVIFDADDAGGLYNSGWSGTGARPTADTDRRTWTNYRLAGVVPPGARRAEVRIYNAASGVNGSPDTYVDVVSLDITEAPTIQWSGASSGEWSATLLSEPKNWVVSGSTTTTDYSEGLALRFLDGATTTAIDISNGDVSPAVMVFDHSAAAYSVSGANGIVGTGGLIKNGSAMLTLATDNIFTGNTSLNAGTLVLGNQNALYSSPLVIASDAVLGFGTVSDPVTNATTAGLSGAGNITLENINSDPVELTAAGGGSYTGILSGAGSLIKSTNSTLVLAGSSTFTGGSTISGGIIRMNNGAALGTGAVAHSGGQVRFSFGNGTATTVANDFSLNTAGHQTFITRGTADAAPSLTTTVRLTGKISGGAAGQTFRLVDSGASGNHFNVLEVQNSANDFQGTIEIWRGTLGITSDGALGDPENDIIHYSESVDGSIRFDADNITLAATRSIQLAVNDAPINTQAFTSTILGPITGGGRFVKQGTGRLILPAIVSHTGISTVAAGTLQVDGTLDTSSSAMTVNSGATLAGTGTISRPVTVSGTIAPGVGIGTLTTGATTINGTYSCEVTGSTADQIVTTDLTLGTASSLAVSDSAGIFPRVIATYSGTLTGTFANVTPGYVVNTSAPGVITLSLALGGFDSWKTQITDVNEQDRNKDPDGDGFTNIQEFLFGSSPLVNNGSLTSTVKSGGNLIIRWNQRVGGASYRLLESSNLTDPWTPSSVVPTDDGAQSGEYQPRKAEVLIGSGSNFFRVEGVED